MRAVYLSLLLLSAMLLPAAPAPAQAPAAPDIRHALIARALTAGACEPEGQMRRCVLSAILVNGVRTAGPVDRATPRQAAYVTVEAIPTPAGLLLLSATAHQERWAPAGDRLRLWQVFLNLLTHDAFGAVRLFHGHVLEASQAFTPSPEDVSATLRLLDGLFLAPQL